MKSENRLVNAVRQPDGRLTLFGLDLQYAETPHFPGRAVVALATDPDRHARTGRNFWVADLARDYGFTDIDGTIPDAEKLHESLKLNAPDYWTDVLGTRADSAGCVATSGAVLSTESPVVSRMQSDASFELPDSLGELPPAIARPVQWKRLKLHLDRLAAGRPEHILESAYSVGDAIGGMSDERHLRRLWRSERGRALLASGSSLPDALADRDALRSMPPGSLGRAFLDFAERHGIDVRALLESEHAVSRDYAQLDPMRRWLSDRLTVSHDLWHVLAGYDATPPGESALMGFSLPQRANDRGAPDLRHDVGRIEEDSGSRCDPRHPAWIACRLPGRRALRGAAAAPARGRTRSARHRAAAGRASGGRSGRHARSRIASGVRVDPVD